jgi:hypothetical protein
MDMKFGQRQRYYSLSERFYLLKLINIFNEKLDRITDGVGFRNFILSDFLAEAEKLFDEVVKFLFTRPHL